MTKQVDLILQCILFYYVFNLLNKVTFLLVKSVFDDLINVILKFYYKHLDLIIIVAFIDIL